MELLRWEWIIFLAPLVVALLLAVASVVGLDGDHEADVEHDAEVDADHDHDAEGTFSFLELLGVGQAPLSVLALCLLFLWSIVGITANFLLGLDRIVVSLVAAGIIALVGTRLLARLLGKLVPSVETYSVARHELVGATATSLYPITATAGTARLFDRLQNLRQLDCRIRPGQEEIPANVRVVIMDYDAQRQCFFVEPEDRVFEQLRVRGEVN